jgi:hypothetical protein
MTTKTTTTKNLNATEARAALRAAFRLDDTAGVCEGKTAAEWHAAAGRHAEAQAESFERCDTDGFVSQWCHGLNRGVDRAKADIAAKGGQALFAVLMLLALNIEVFHNRQLRPLLAQMLGPVNWVLLAMCRFGRWIMGLIMRVLSSQNKGS